MKPLGIRNESRSIPTGKRDQRFQQALRAIRRQGLTHVRTLSMTGVFACPVGTGQRRGGGSLPVVTSKVIVPDTVTSHWPGASSDSVDRCSGSGSGGAGLTML